LVQTVDNKKHKSWAKGHLWETMQLIAENQSVSYDQLLFTIFEGDETALQSLVTANLLRIVHNPDTGRMDKVMAATPLYYYAFKKMVKDPTLSTGMDIALRRWKIAGL